MVSGQPSSVDAVAQPITNETTPGIKKRNKKPKKNSVPQVQTQIRPLQNQQSFRLSNLPETVVVNRFPVHARRLLLSQETQKIIGRKLKQADPDHF